MDMYRYVCVHVCTSVFPAYIPSCNKQEGKREIYHDIALKFISSQHNIHNIQLYTTITSTLATDIGRNPGRQRENSS